MDARRAAELLRALTEEHAVPGAQLALYTGSKIVSVATGVVRAGEVRRVDTDTMFAFGSVTKAFTATLALQLVADGDVGLDEPMADLLPSWRRTRSKALARITLRHLLSHTAGLVADHQLADMGDRSLARYAASVADLPVLCAPGSRFSYANTGYNVVGQLIEELSGMPWQTALREFLLEPLGAEPRLLNARDGSGRATASGHVVQPGGRAAVPVNLFLPATWAPAGGLVGSAEDLLALARLHIGAHLEADRLLDTEHRSQMHRTQEGADAFGMANGWALGLGSYGDGDAWLGHDGTVDGATCHLRFHPATGTAVALTTNATTGTLLWPDLVDRLRRRGVPVGDYEPALDAPPADGPESVDPDHVVGDYANGDTVFSVRPHGDGVRLSDRTGLVADLTLHRRLAFEARRLDSGQAPWIGRFLMDDDAPGATLMQLTGRSAARVPTAA
ncbi:serine hydrolase domain-containing protein [Streptomyces sp. NPDC048301]|uniref:serine hydrolase domain-containing protein n=1 Tax=Streptomyces sp. NPDC048301 TaxID=3155631 RepID=UPI003427480A